MNSKPTTIRGVLVIFIWCIFMGVTAISIGFGALFPSMDLIAQPFVCPNGQMQNTSQYYQVSPSTSETTITWYCVDSKTGKKTELGIFPMSLYSGVIYGLLLFAVVMIVRYFMSKRTTATGPLPQSSMSWPQQRGQFTPSTTFDRHTHEAAEDTANTRGRLQELKELHSANLISDEEYQKKRAEILKDV